MFSNRIQLILFAQIQRHFWYFPKRVQRESRMTKINFNYVAKGFSAGEMRRCYIIHSRQKVNATSESATIWNAGICLDNISFKCRCTLILADLKIAMAARSPHWRWGAFCNNLFLDYCISTTDERYFTNC